MVRVEWTERFEYDAERTAEGITAWETFLAQSVRRAVGALPGLPPKRAVKSDLSGSGRTAQ